MIIKFECPLIDNKGLFYTDSNGLNMMKRELDTMKTIPESYYPVSKAIVLNQTSEGKAT